MQSIQKRQSSAVERQEGPLGPKETRIHWARRVVAAQRQLGCETLLQAHANEWMRSWLKSCTGVSGPWVHMRVDGPSIPLFGSGPTHSAREHQDLKNYHRIGRKQGNKANSSSYFYNGWCTLASGIVLVEAWRSLSGDTYTWCQMWGMAPTRPSISDT